MKKLILVFILCNPVSSAAENLYTCENWVKYGASIKIEGKSLRAYVNGYLIGFSFSHPNIFKIKNLEDFKKWYSYLDKVCPKYLKYGIDEIFYNYALWEITRRFYDFQKSSQNQRNLLGDCEP